MSFILMSNDHARRRDASKILRETRNQPAGINESTTVDQLKQSLSNFKMSAVYSKSHMQKGMFPFFFFFYFL